MNQKSSKLLVGFLLGVVALVLLWWPRETQEVNGVNPRHEPTSAVREAENRGASRSAKDQQQGVRSAVATDALEAGTLDQEAGEDAKMILEGKLVIHELDGRVTHDSDGVLNLVLDQGKGGPHVAIEVHRGTWRVELDRLADGTFTFGASSPEEVRGIHRFLVASCEVVGPPAIRIEDEQALVPGESGIVIALRRAPRLILNVHSAATGEQLDSVSVVVFDMGNDNRIVIPGVATPETYLVRLEGSPVAVTPRTKDVERGVVECLIGAPGFAWRLLALDFRTGLQRRVDLEPAGGVTVFLDREPDQGDAEVRLYVQVEQTFDEEGALASFDWDLLAGQPAQGSGPFEFTGLPAGLIQVALERGDWWDEPQVLASELVQVEAHQEVSVSLSIAQVAETRQAGFAGKLLLADEWGEDSPKLRLSSSGPGFGGQEVERVQAAHALEEGVYRFDFGQLQTGEYVLTCLNPKYSVPVEITSAGDSSFHFEVPQPIEISVYLMDRFTGEVAPVEALYWEAASPARVDGGMDKPAGKQPGSQAFAWVAPRGPVEVIVMEADYLFFATTLEAEPGASFNLYLDRAVVGVLRLVDAESQVSLPWPEVEDGLGMFEMVGEDGRLGTFNSHGKQAHIRAAPGRYRLQVPKVDGYADQPAVEFDLIPGQALDLSILLRRED